MADEMSITQLPLTLIVAATTKNGIGNGGGLPWPMLKKEMAYFARVTKRVPPPSNTGSVQSDLLKQTMLEGTRRNVVIMGRKTWESIPPKFRPLKDRTNIVISSQDRANLGPLPEEVIVAADIISSLRELGKAATEGKVLPVGRAFIIGGSSIYKAALGLAQTKDILLTRILKDYDCDTFFPAGLENGDSRGTGWQRKGRQELQAFIGEEIPEGLMVEGNGDDEVQYEFQLYERA